MSTRKKLFIFGGLAAVAAVVLAGAAVYSTLVPGDAPARANLSDAVASVSQTQDANATATASADTRAAGLTGTWVLAENGESFVGYRVQEELASIGTFTAVGRTQNLTATLAFDGSAITDVQVTADLTGLTSDNSMRDGQLRRQALETDTYPTATFDLTEPIELDGVPAEGETISATAVGDLTLHSVTRSVSIPLEGQLSNGYVVVVGSLDIQFADYDIQKPTSAAVLGVEDHGVLELQVVFQQGTQG
ncbi:MAG: YceI family protein [Dehalococcoidia bacterium]